MISLSVDNCRMVHRIERLAKTALWNSRICLGIPASLMFGRQAGRILVTGMIPADPEVPDGTRSGLILCLSPDGRLDQSFGHQGQCFIAPSETMSGFGAFSTIVEHPQGGYVAAGQVIIASKGDLWFAKTDPDGSWIPHSETMALSGLT